MTDSEYDLLIRELRGDADEAVMYLGFVRAFISDAKGIWDRLEGSWSGRAGVTARSAAEIALVLYCARAWDRDDDAMSIGRACKELRALAALRNRNSSPKLDECYDAFQKAFAEAEAKPGHQHLRFLRNEFFAHRLEACNERKRLGQGASTVSATYNDLIDLSAATIDLVGQLGWLWDRIANPYPGRIERETECCREFWRNVPVLREVEGPRP